MTNGPSWLDILAIGIFLAVLGTAQFELVVRLSGDSDINPVINGILMWLSWA